MLANLTINSSVFFALITCLFVIFIIGNLFFSLFQSNYKKYTAQFLIFIIGIFSAIIITSLFLSKGITFNLVSTISIPIILILTHQKIVFKGFWERFKSNIHPEFLFLIIPALLYFWIQSFNYYNPFTNEKFCLEGDQLYYATIGNYLYQFGIENRFLDTLNISKIALNPYHYGDSWFVAFFLNFLPFNPPIILNYICNPILLIGFYVGSLSILERYKNDISVTDKLLLLFIPLFTTISFPVFDFLPGQLYSWSIINLPKLSINYLGIQLFFVLLINKKHSIALYIMLPFFILYLVSLPIIFSVCFLLIFYFLYCEKITKIECYKLLGFYCFFVFVLCFAYSIFSEKSNPNIQKIDLLNIIQTNPFLYLKTFVNCIIGSVLLTIAGLFIYLLTYYFYQKPTLSLYKILLKNELLISFTTFYIVSLGFYAIFNYNPDGAQLWYNTFYPLVGTLCCIFISFFLKENTIKLKYLLVLGFIGLNLYYNSPIKAKCPKMINNKPRLSLNQQASFYNNIRIKINNNKNPKVVFLKNYEQANVFSKNPFSSNFPENASIIKNYFPICLSVFEIPNTKDSINYVLEKNMISNTVFYKFVANERSKSTFVSIEDSQLKFIMDYEIDYIEIDKKTKLPPKIQLLVKEEIINPVTGDRFLILEKSNF
jgi:hypothetical protein